MFNIIHICLINTDFFFFLEEYFMYKDILVNESSMFWVAWSSVPIDVGFL